MDIILHLGAHRSATTTFQSFLHTNRRRLARRGVTCWTPKRTRDGLFSGLMCHPELTAADDIERSARSVARISHEVDRLECEDQDALLVSEENLIGSMRNNVRDGQLYPCLTPRLDRFLPAFAGRPIKIGLCVRSYENYWASGLNYLVSKGAGQPTPHKIEVLATQDRRWRDVIRDIACAIPSAEIVVWPFERMANAPNSVLGNLWTGDVRGLDTSKAWVNRSPDIVQLNKMMALRGDAPLQGKLMSPKRHWQPFDERQRRVLRAEYRRDLSWLSAGADGLARFVDGWPTSATCPDRLEDTDAFRIRTAHMRGRRNGIEKGLGRTRAG